MPTLQEDLDTALRFIRRYALQHCEVPYEYKCMHCTEVWDFLKRLGAGDGA